MIDNFIRLIEEIKQWGIENDSIKAIILVGSYARGAQKPTSDVDLVILTTEKPYIVADPSLFSRFGVIREQQLELYGAVTSVRTWYENGLEVEYSIAELSWLDIPLDAGTKKVLTDGYKIILDKCGYFDKLRVLSL